MVLVKFDGDWHVHGGHKRNPMSQPKVPRISETEWEVMKVIWPRAPVTAAVIIEALIESDPTWHPKTVKTLLGRLVRKGVLMYKQSGRAYIYSPRFTEEECVGAVSDSFLKRVFDGSLRPMLAHFVQRKRLSAAELRDLRRILEREGR
jgi:BlaI family transcriptional regulator, penicillinase repressor